MHPGILFQGQLPSLLGVRVADNLPCQPLRVASPKARPFPGQPGSDGWLRPEYKGSLAPAAGELSTPRVWRTERAEDQAPGVSSGVTELQRCHLLTRAGLAYHGQGPGWEKMKP